ncbi:uncharacterized protein LOC135846920 [Planococcus citri]|uniref:uncharacterized protein LOC135846920 n=1 Tax=Planococcus citri TaxID=170843 RepID=UPI0031F7A537
MNLIWILFISSSIITLIKETASLNEVILRRGRFRTPLAVIKKHDSTKLQLAIPRKCTKNHEFVGYQYDNSVDLDDRPKETLLIACPDVYRFGKQKEVESEWKKYHATSKESVLFFLMKYSTISPYLQCTSRVVPSISEFSNEEAQYCNQSGSEMYQVGYPLSLHYTIAENFENFKSTQEVEFLSVYKVCFSMAEGKGATKYTIHRIESPALLLLDQIKQLPDIQPMKSYEKSFLDSILNREFLEDEDKKYYAYQIVGTEDMPTGSWEPTTKFLFNYIPIARNDDIFKGMIRVDYYIRLYSKKNNKPLTLYSGTYRAEIESNICIIMMFCNPTIIESFWRIIMDDENRVIFLVTQYTEKECGRTYLCNTDRQEKTYERGGCTYTCSLNTPTNVNLFQMLDLPPLTVTGDLDFTFEVQIDKTDNETVPQDKTEFTEAKSSKNIDIVDFLNNPSFFEAVRNIDADIAKNLSFESMSADADSAS